ncbi:hypothetical protein HYV81_06120 [Candidatus Woesearchaeota archaeon]|nr:hypothetical protein [Candidatus Woesearchaeota archaeon]
MSRKLIEQASESLRKGISEKAEAAQFEDDEYKAAAFDERHFRNIEDADPVKIAFVDGSNLEIVRSAHFSLQFVRLFYTLYDGKKRVAAEKAEFYAMIRAVNRDERIYFEVEVISNDAWLDELNMKIYSFDASMRQGYHRADVSSVVHVVRRLGELLIAERACQRLGKGGILVLDGDLEANYPREEEFLDRLYAYAKDVVIAGVSKTSTLLSSSGNSFTALLNRRIGKWYYYPVADIEKQSHKAALLFARLHEKSSYVFKVEVYKEQAAEIGHVVSALASHANDAVFIGYPYGLIEAHQFAKIPATEKDFHRIQLMAKLGREWQDIERAVKSTDAHEVLDRV